MKSDTLLIKLDEQKIVGTEIRTTNQNEQNVSTAKIPAHWATFFASQADTSGLIVLYTNYEGDFCGEYSHVIGHSVASLDNHPSNFKSFIVPAGTFLKFTGKGEMPDVVMDTWKEAWNYFTEDAAHQRSYATDMEIYTSDGVEIYVSIE